MLVESMVPVARSERGSLPAALYTRVQRPRDDPQERHSARA
jgi:hypothetical protein